MAVSYQIPAVGYDSLPAAGINSDSLAAGKQ
jgi:hypothetical protein